MLKLLSEVSAANGPPADTAASITLVAVAGANLVDGESFTIMREDREVFTFEFDDDSDVVETDTLIAVDFDALDSATDVGDAIVTAIEASNCGCVASNSSGTVTISRRVAGPKGNGGHNTEAVTNGSFSISAAFAGGALDGFALIGDQPGMGTGYGWRGEDRGTFQADGVGDDVTLRSHGRSKASGVWLPMGSTNATETLRGVLHAGAAIEDESGVIVHNENVSGLSAFDRIYLEVVSINGTPKSITAYLVERA